MSRKHHISFTKKLRVSKKKKSSKDEQGLLTSEEVRLVRTKLKLTQKQASAICGGGPNAFSRYETGKAKPLRSICNLLRFLMKYPQELKILLNNQEIED